VKSNVNKRGIIFALDGAIAVTIVLIMLINTTFYFTTTSKDSLSQTQVVKRGYDVLAMFDRIEKLDAALRGIVFGQEYIGEPGASGLNVTDFLPVGYDMVIELEDATRTECVGSCSLGGVGPDFVEVDLIPLQKGGYLYVQVNAILSTSVSGEPTFTVDHGSNSYSITKMCPLNDICTYTTLEPINFSVGVVDQVNVTWDSSNEIDVQWVKVLDDPSYSLMTNRTVPNDRFIGSGERWYSAFDSNGHFEGVHRAKFKVWLV
jgi:hypothetical protein